MDKVWCEHCNNYTYQTSGGCSKCGKVTLNVYKEYRSDDYKPIKITVNGLEYYK